MATIIDPSISYIINNNLAQYHDLFMECCHHTAEFPKGAILSRSGDPIPYMYFMLEGMVKVYTIGYGLLENRSRRMYASIVTIK